MSTQNDEQVVLLDFDALRERFGLTLSRPTVYRMVRDGRLPAPIKSNAARCGRLFWRASEVETYLARWQRVPITPAAAA